jgi:hypothetical protein
MNIFNLLLILTYAYIYVALSSKVHDKISKRRLFLIAIIFLTIGIIFERFLTKPNNYNYITLSFLPLTQLICFELTSKLLNPFIGKYPYMPFREKIGAKVIGNGFPKNRRVKYSDYLFMFIQLLFPLILIIIILAQINRN